MDIDFSVFEQAGLTQGEAAKQAGVSRLTYIRWLKGQPPGPNSEKRLKQAITLTKAAMKLGFLPTRLPHSRGNRAARERILANTYAETRRIIEDLKAKRQG